MNPWDLFKKRGYFIGPFAAVYAWLAILSAGLLNPSWTWTVSALSYLGAPSANDPWVYNDVAMIPSGVLLAAFAVYLWTLSRNRWEKVGSACFVLGGILLVGVGTFHQGPYPAGTPYPGQDLHDLFSAWFFLQALLAVIFWGLGLRKTESRPLGSAMIALALVTVAVAGALAALRDLPGATGEVLGVSAIDIWVGLLALTTNAPPVTTEPGEQVRTSAKRSVLHAVQLPALVLVVVGMALFFYGNDYLTSNLPALIFQKISVDALAVRTLALYLVGYVLILLGAWRWSLVLPRWAGAVLLALVLIVPLVMVTTWFSTFGDGLMLVFFIAVTAAIPLALSLWSWRVTSFSLTDRRVLARPGRTFSEPAALMRDQVGSLSLRRTLVHGRMGLGDISFLPKASEGSPANDTVVWRGVRNPAPLLADLERELSVPSVPSRWRRPRPALLAVVLAILIPVILLLCLVPVFSVTTTLNLGCALYLSNTQALESDPWPYIHNVTVPLGHVTFHWWSGAPVYLVIGQLPVGLAYQNTNISSLEPADQSELTSSGAGSYSSYGGSSFAACIGTSSSDTVTLQLTYPSPLVWE